MFEKLPHQDHLVHVKDDHLNQLKEDRLNQRIKSLTNENEVLEEMLKNKTSEISKLDKQFRSKMVKRIVCMLFFTTRKLTLKILNVFNLNFHFVAGAIFRVET